MHVTRNVYETWMRTWCIRRDRSFAQNRTVPPQSKRRGSVGMRWYGAMWAQYVPELLQRSKEWDSRATRAGRARRAKVGGAHSKPGAWHRSLPSSSISPGRGEHTCSGFELRLTRSSAHAHRFARVVPLPQAVQHGAVPAPSHPGDGWRTLAVLEHPRREATAQRRGVEVSSGGELFTPVDERLA